MAFDFSWMLLPPGHFETIAEIRRSSAAYGHGSPKLLGSADPIDLAAKESHLRLLQDPASAAAPPLLRPTTTTMGREEGSSPRRRSSMTRPKRSLSCTIGLTHGESPEAFQKRLQAAFKTTPSKAVTTSTHKPWKLLMIRLPCEFQKVGGSPSPMRMRKALGEELRRAWIRAPQALFESESSSWVKMKAKIVRRAKQAKQERQRAWPLSSDWSRKHNNCNNSRSSSRSNTAAVAPLKR
mmetsp:Transcript_91939/g.192249  ORF Transcript_91939/g.192249 Transcript_91939/m.192249 type:complete len:238 (-) Transcript_91939:146-859(-)